MFSRAVVIDLETTGYSAKKSEIIEVAALTWTPTNGLEDDWSTLVMPKKSIPNHITEITGISAETFQKEPYCSLDEATEQLQQIIGDPDTLLVGHNIIKFDLPFLKAAGFNINPRRIWDTLLQTRVDIKRQYLPSWYESQKKANTYRTKQKINLPDAAQFYKVKLVGNRHRAAPDALVALDIFLKQIRRKRRNLWKKQQ